MLALNQCQEHILEQWDSEWNWNLFGTFLELIQWKDAILISSQENSRLGTLVSTIDIATCAKAKHMQCIRYISAYFCAY